MLIRLLVLVLVFCTACRTGIIPCPEVKGLRLKKSQVNRKWRPPQKRITPEQTEAVLTVSSDAKTPQATKGSNRYKYVKYTIQHVDVEEMDCPKPGEKKKMSRGVRDNIKKNRKRVIYYYADPSADSTSTSPGTRR